jgi:hypothetical protein
MMGQEVCHKHGGNSPQAKAAAKRRLLNMAESALDLLELTIDAGISDLKPARGGKRKDPSMVTVKASTSVLDRAGLGPVKSLDITTDEASESIPIESLSQETLEMIQRDLREWKGE